jgi:PHD/YefM family antitoxin component YafN of YafNO toxin-antitoxin module
MSDSTKISDARRRLFDLVDQVIEHDDVVYIEHRDRSERVALVREGRLRYLEALEGSGEANPRSLVGTIKLVSDSATEDSATEDSAAELISESREAERLAFKRRLSEWTGSGE